MSPLQILKPPRYDEKLEEPLIFLAGPIQSASDWQAMAIRFLDDWSLGRENFRKKFPEGLAVASPRRPLEMEGDFDDDKFNEQVKWEHFHLDYAAKNGVTLFWLPRPQREIPGRAYAQTSRFELGEAMTRHRLEGAKLVVGVQHGFSGERYIKRTLQLKAPDVPVCGDLWDSLMAVWKILARK